MKPQYSWNNQIDMFFWCVFFLWPVEMWISHEDTVIRRRHIQFTSKGPSGATQRVPKWLKTKKNAQNHCIFYDFFSLWQWRAKLSVQTLSSSAGKLDVNKSDGLHPWLAQTKGLKGLNVAKKEHFCFNVDELVHHIYILFMEFLLFIHSSILSFI